LTKITVSVIFFPCFRDFLLSLNVTDNLETSVDLNETMHAMPMSTISHENDVVVLLLVHYWRLEVLQKPIESEDVNKYTVIWKVYTAGKFSI